jgi:hypothetical protein
MMHIVRDIFWLSVKHDVKITGSFIPGKSNVLADKISRLHSVFDANVARFLLSGMTDALVYCYERKLRKYRTIWILSLLLRK